MRIAMFLLISLLLACSDSDPCDPVNHTMKGQFMLVKAVGYQPTDVGGPNIDDPFIIEWVPHTYEHPDITGAPHLGRTYIAPGCDAAAAAPSCRRLPCGFTGNKMAV